MDQNDNWASGDDDGHNSDNGAAEETASEPINVDGEVEIWFFQSMRESEEITWLTLKR